MNLAVQILESWDRQALIVNRVAELVTEETRQLRPSADGMTLEQQLAHMGEVRCFFLAMTWPEVATKWALRFEPWGRTSTGSLELLKSELKRSGEAVREAVAMAIEAGSGPCGGYDNPVLFLQHMTWHEGWHVGLIFLGLRLGGHEPSEEWEEGQVWSVWRTE